MAGAYPNYILERKSPQYAYALVILSGGIGLIIFQLGDLVAALLFYALLAALFSSIWPNKALLWGGWLCLPIVLLVCFDVLISGSFRGLGRNGLIFVKVFPAACLGAYVGSQLSIKIATRFVNMRAHRKGLNRNGYGVQDRLVLKKNALPTASFKIASSGHSSNGSAQKVKQSAHSDGLNQSLLQAAQEGDLNRVETLVAGGADVNAAHGDQWTPLMMAARTGEVEMVRTLFEKGAVPDASSSKGWTALMIATIEGRAEIVRALLEHGADLSIQNNKGWTALRFAVSMDETEILRLLLKAGADVNLADHEGTTALMQAAGENIEESLKALLEAGADPDIKDNNGLTALMIARRRNHSRIIKLLKEAEGKAAAGASATDGVSVDDDSYLYLIKEELEDKLGSCSHSPLADDAVSRVLRALQNVQEHIDATSKGRSPDPSEISHKLLLTLKEAATLSGLPRQHLVEAIEGEKLKARLLEHGWHIRRADLDDYIRRLC